MKDLKRSESYFERHHQDHRHQRDHCRRHHRDQRRQRNRRHQVQCHQQGHQ